MPQSKKGPTKSDLPSELVDELLGRTANRSRIVVEHILEHGCVSTTELKDTYGYDHPPRAARDVRERGIPLETVTVSEGGRRIGYYRLPDKVALDRDRKGRVALPKAFRDEVLAHHDHRDAFSGEQFSARQLQVDHRVPYEVGGEPDELVRDEFMPLTAEMNRAKSWECEHCPNFTDQDADVCRSCYWAYPDGDYTHVATRDIRRADIVWAGEEVATYDRLRQAAAADGVTVPEAIKRRLER